MSDKRLSIFIFKIIPKGFISRLFGFLTRLHLPQGILNPVIEWYCKKYGVKKEEILYPEDGFKTFDQFFTRYVKSGVHTFDNAEKSVISPVDGRIYNFGKINNNSIIQAKGIEYYLDDLIPSNTYREFIDGSFVTIYLSPADYHHIHSPVSGSITGYFSIPGKLFTVQEFMVNGLKGLFSKNERVISYIKNDNGLAAVCKIGAMNVGRITLSYSDVVTNRTIRKRREYFYSSDTQPHVDKGEEVGVFHLGSTVILLFQKDMVKFDNIEPDSLIRLGERIAFFK